MKPAWSIATSSSRPSAPKSRRIRSNHVVAGRGLRNRNPSDAHATAIGQPKAVRAVANACANNRVALVIPCHRVIREDGKLGGYRWGVERKEKLLATEKAK